ncbi:lysophospholipid acyltransferase family protein [Candidatus Thioglobus autotrophicus]|uniref:lysophospholipid acyltransferase family protein n=1 Tax=Candidatus Thioglobus autotrophicus TaxID=1705394 RepID=UPI00299D6363|nr:lysophospholipid acyltransferase family protein [Candidatus Thioglobus autotrophicus]WPE17199.1 lysophospholipid acyltransferase family protein [Candidatus Thioglobus autotrophicus]
MINFILKFFAMMPLRLNHLIGSLIGYYLYMSDSDSKKIVHKNIQTCFPNLAKSEQQDLIKKSLIETGKGLSESGFIWLRSFKDNAKHITKTNGSEHLNSDQPIILLVPHFGCWEITGRVLSIDTPITFLYKPLRKAKQEALLIKNRQKQGLTMASADKKGVIKLQRAIKNKELIGILPDQDPGEEGSVLAPFFGTNARSMTLLVKLARKNNAKVLLTWAFRLPKGKGYELNLQPVDILSEQGSIEADVALMNQVIEDLVKIQPEQYLWNYKRFKSVVDYSS